MTEVAIDAQTSEEGDIIASVEPRNLSELAEELFVAGKLGECLVVLEAAKTDGSLRRELVERQKMVVQMHASAQRKDWWKVWASASISSSVFGPQRQV